MVTITSLDWPALESSLRLSILFSDGTRQAGLRRSAGLLKRHFETDYSDPKENSDGLDGQGLFSVANYAVIEENEEGSMMIDLLVYANNGMGYSVKEVRGIDEIFSEADLYATALANRSYNVDT